MKWLNKYTKYLWIGYTSARSSLAYAGEVSVRTIFMAVILYIFLRLWTAVYSGAGGTRQAGLTLPEMLWYLMLTEALWLSSTRVWSEVDEDVRTGRLAVQMLRPMSYSWALLSKTLGERCVRFGINLLAGSAVAMILVGPIRFTVSGLLMFAVVLPLAFVLEALGLLVVGLFAFWVESTAGIALLYMRTAMLAGGTMLPLDLYPESLRSICNWLPFSTMVYGPARMLVAPNRAFLGHVLVTQALALIVFVLAVVGIQHLAVKRIQSNGG